MKKLLVLALMVPALASAGFSSSNQAQGGGFNGANGGSKVSTVAQALKAHDDAPIVLSGYIISQIKHDEFMFRDSTGEIRIDVDDEAWQGQNVTEKDKITIYGKVDKSDWGKREVEVYRIQKH